MSTAAPAALATVAGPVEARLREVLDAETRRWAAVDPDLEAPMDSLGRFVLAGGKRLRPAFCHWAFVGAGGAPDDPAVIDTGAAFELLHAFALVHDDVMDGSATRRGEQTVHVEFDATHADATWRGESRRFGEGVAILIGDLAEVFADRLMTGRTERGVRRLERAEDRAQRGPVPRRARHGAGRHRPRHRPPHRPLQVRQVHDRAAAPRGRRPRRPPRRAPGPPCPPTAPRWARPSSSATTSSARSATPTAPASRSATTSARASPPRCSPSPGSGPPAPTPPSSTGSAGPTSAADEIAAIQAQFTASGARAEIEDTITALTDEAVTSLEGAPLLPVALDALRELAAYVASRDT